jgi:L-fuculose-phosphate aldolase
MVAKAGGDDIRCARYATYGTAALSRSALAALAGGRRACLLANHGLLAPGADLGRSSRPTASARPGHAGDGWRRGSVAA